MYVVKAYTSQVDPWANETHVTFHMLVVDAACALPIPLATLLLCPCHLLLYDSCSFPDQTHPPVKLRKYLLAKRPSYLLAECPIHPCWSSDRRTCGSSERGNSQTSSRDVDQTSGAGTHQSIVRRTCWSNKRHNYRSNIWFTHRLIGLYPLIAW